MQRRDLLAFGLAALGSRFALAAGGDASSWQADFDAFVADGMHRTAAPGLGVALVKGDKPLFMRGYGLADAKRNIPVTIDTAFHLASVSKTVTGAAMMMLMQGGAFHLDDPVGAHLDFPVVHPKFPDVPITFRQLFTHTSGISDVTYEKTGEFSNEDDSKLPLRDFLTGYLSPKGRWYDAAGCYSDNRPGTQWSYSNVAVALLGYLAGRVGKTGLDTFTQQRLFEPLGMRNTAWRPAALKGTTLSLPYDDGGTVKPALPLTVYPDWPAGMLRSSPRDFARFVSIFTNRGVVDGTRYLEAASIDAMFTSQFASPEPDNPTVHQGLIWALIERDGKRFALHHGGDPGASTIVAIDILNGTGALAFANISSGDAIKGFLTATAKRLLKQAGT